MPKIRFSARCYAADLRESDEAPLITDPKILSDLDGLAYTDEIFSDYLGDGGDTSLIDIVTGGHLCFKYLERESELIGYTEYELSRKLTSDEESMLREYTLDQWSDGIGSNFIQERADVGLVPVFAGSDVTTSYES